MFVNEFELFEHISHFKIELICLGNNLILDSDSYETSALSMYYQTLGPFLKEKSRIISRSPLVTSLHSGAMIITNILYTWFNIGTFNLDSFKIYLILLMKERKYS